MKQYDVKIFHAALSDMEQIYSYIADRLLEPDTAISLYRMLLTFNYKDGTQTVRFEDALTADGVEGKSSDLFSSAESKPPAKPVA